MSKMLAQRYHKKMLECNKNNHKSTKIIIKSTDISLDRQASSASVIYFFRRLYIYIIYIKKHDIS